MEYWLKEPNVQERETQRSLLSKKLTPQAKVNPVGHNFRKFLDIRQERGQVNPALACHQDGELSILT
jgi:hypothetical protein